MVDKAKYKVIGTRPIRHDGADKVTGRAIYTDDFQLPGMLHGQVVRCPYPHARIKSIDISQAEQQPGVFAVVTSADFPDLTDKIANLGEGAVNLVHLASNVLAQKKALYKGHAVAAVAASTRHLAEAAAALIKVEYEQLPSVTSIQDAMREDAPLLHDNLVTDSPLGENSDKPSNIATHLH
ncbi:MAG: xanthine dehydrogenase family protein molybdopterin-binding subunit, partial [Planctomycetaceae bacterium]